jgi:uncharacterized protein
VSTSRRPDPRPWMLVARESAERQATLEARYQWGLRPGATPPFNYRFEHIKSVVRIAVQLADALAADREVVLAAAWLHDVAKAAHEEFGDGHGLRGAEKAKEILRTTDFPPDKLEAVGVAIVAHVGLFRDEPPPTLEAAILYDADKLSKLGGTSLIHFLCSYPAVARKADKPADTSAIANEQVRWLELAPRMVGSLATEPGRAMGQQRLAFLRSFVEQLQHEGASASVDDFASGGATDVD